MFELELFDRKGVKLIEGNIVKVSDGKRFEFFAEVKYLVDEKAIAPFHTFSFHSFEKVDSVPADAVQSTEERYRIWYVPGDLAEQDLTAKDFDGYLMDWRQCEHLLQRKCFRIQLIDNCPTTKYLHNTRKRSK